MADSCTTDPDPFSTTANPKHYVPRTATEAVLVRLEIALRGGAPTLSMHGASGSGKTMLLHVLAERLGEDFQTHYVPYPKLDPTEFCQWALSMLHETRTDEPERALFERLSRDVDVGFSPQLWMIDDAGSLPVETARLLVAMQAQIGSGLRLLFVHQPGAAIDALARSRPEWMHVELEERMQPAETARYVRTRLDRSSPPLSERALLEGALDRLHVLSGGNPGQLHRAVAQLQLSPTQRPPVAHAPR